MIECIYNDDFSDALLQGIAGLFGDGEITSQVALGSKGYIWTAANDNLRIGLCIDETRLYYSTNHGLFLFFDLGDLADPAATPQATADMIKSNALEHKEQHDETGCNSCRTRRNARGVRADVPSNAAKARRRRRGRV